MLLHREYNKKKVYRALNLSYSIVSSILLLLTIFMMTLSFYPFTKKTVSHRTSSNFSIILAVDVSQSMLTQDVYPNRLEKIKNDISDSLDSIKGVKMGVVAFAGSSVLKSPVTSDLTFVKEAINQLSTKSVSRGGSLIGDAFRFIDNYMVSSDQDVIIILISDGGDQDSYLMEIVKEINQKEIPIITIGVGNADSYSLVLNGEGEPLQYLGQPVVSRLEEATLKSIGESSSLNTYIPMGTNNLDFIKLFNNLKTNGLDISTRNKQNNEVIYQLNLGITVFFLFAFGIYRLVRK
ncbi:vWA domain-containing protein [Spirochaeta cellobiosiphila]|uniref:vWA domain-containing protein n=1 Tax=Spirochaeta cellobiosiphila TaxID=504483 RepID=UPI00146B4D1C|nr:VWA domain-containing protein [Spirochaeta cellobiosiphila]